jgi:hypothetical protein
MRTRAFAGRFTRQYQISLFDALCVHRPYEATDPQDKIYDLMGLIRDRDDKDLLAFQPRYDISVEKLYKRFALRSIEAGKLEETLWACRRPRKIEHLPSWTPDWSANPPGASITLSAIEPDNQFTASGPLEKSIKLSDNTDILGIQGIVLGTVEKLGSLLLSEASGWSPQNFRESLLLLVNSEDHNMEHQHETLESILTKYNDDLGEDYIAGGTLFDAYEWTLLAIIPTVSLDTIRNPADNNAIVLSTTDSPYTAIPTNMSDWTLRLGISSIYRKFGISSDGYMCLVPERRQRAT